MKRFYAYGIGMAIAIILALPSLSLGQKYCTPSYKGSGFNGTGKPTSFYTHILEVHIADIDAVNPAPIINPAPNYQDYTNLITDLAPGATYPLTIKLGNGANPQYMAVWVDWDQDHIFEKYERMFARFDPANLGDHEFHLSLTVPKNAAIGTTRMRVGTRLAADTIAFIPDPCTNNSFLYDWGQDFQDYGINVVKPDVQVYSSSTSFQPDHNEILPGDSNNMILQIAVHTNSGGVLNPLTAGDFKFALSGTSNTTDITGAKLFYSGQDQRFNVAKQVGSTSGSPSTYFSINANQQLAPGVNYFWLTYDVSSSALRGNKVDAEVYSVNVIGDRVPDVISPSGDRKVGYCPSHGVQNNFVNLYYFSFNSIYNISNVDTGGYGNYTRLSTTLFRGNKYKMFLYVGNGANDAYTRAWIDFNADGDFNDAGEVVLFDSLKANPGYYLLDTLTIPIPSTAKIGPTRLRLESFFKPTPYVTPKLDACRNPVDIGEVEDYTVVIAENGQPVAYFKVDTVCLGSATTFKDSSYTFGPYSVNKWHWDFGDGDTSIIKNPKHTYAAAGSYVVTLIANSSLPGTPSVIKKTITVNSPKADFTNLGSVVKTAVPFADKSSGGIVKTWRWDFGDPASGAANNSSTLSNPIHEFDTAGIYAVKLTITMAGGCKDVITKNITIVTARTPVASFSASNFAPHQTEKVNMKDLSLYAPTSWSWTVTSGAYTFYSSTSSSQNPTISLDDIATYKVTLKVSNSAGSDTISHFFTTSAYSKPVADFTTNNQVVKAGQAISFLDISKNDPTAWLWQMGNSDTVYVQNPIYKYKNTGIYTVSMDVTNPAGTDNQTKVNFITVENNYVMCQSDAAYSLLFSGEIGDSGDSSDYFNFSNCGFLIKPECSGPITLVFDSFLMQDHDYIRVYDGEDNTGIPLFNGLGYTDVNLPPTLTASKSGAMFIEEITDGGLRGQGFRARWSAVPNAKPKADFTPDTVGYVGGPANFQNTTVVGVNNMYAWDYNNDGKIDDSSKDGSYSFASAGTYKVKLIVVNCKGRDSVTKTIKIVNPVNVPVADFYASSDTVVIGDSITFYDHSTNGPNQWTWSFNPNTVNYTSVSSYASRNPSIYPVDPGALEATLISKNKIGSGNATTKKIVYVKDAITMCSAASSSALAGKLYDAGGAHNNYRDSATCSFLINPCAQQLFLYFKYFDLYPGDQVDVYDGIDNTGSLIATYAGGSGSALPVLTSKSGSFFIVSNTNTDGITGPGFDADWWTTPYPKPSSAFTAYDTAYTGGSPAHFDATDQNADRWDWDFDGDGKTDANAMHARYQYAAKGTYKVRLVVGRCSQTDTSYKTIVVIDPANAPKAKFTADILNAATTDTVQFTDRSTNGPNSWEWTITPNTYNFAYGYNANSQDPAVQFNATGKYTVQLKASNKIGQDSIVKTDYIRVFKYCVPAVGNSNLDVGFSRVKIGNIDNSSAVASQPYTDYTHQFSTRLELSGTYAIHLERLKKSPPQFNKVWIDFNQNGSFDDAGEMVVNDKKFPNFTTWTDSFIVPKTALEGPTRMRVGSGVPSDSTFSCGGNNLGEYEDYRVVIGGDITAPIITLKGYSPVKQEVGFPYIDSGATAYDAIDGNITKKIKTSSNVDINTVGVYSVQYTVHDTAGNKASALRLVSITGDKTPPTLTLVGPDPLKIGVFYQYTEFGAKASDKRDGDVSKNVSIDRSEVDTFRVGTYHVYYTAVDNAGNFSTQVKRTVNVVDTSAPVIKLVGADTIEIIKNTKYIEPGATVTDNYWPGLKATITGTVDTSKNGTYVLRYDAQDLSKNVARTIQRVVVVGTSGIDEQLPEGWQLNIFPVPARDNFVIKLKMPEPQLVTLELLNSLGQVIESRDGGKIRESEWQFHTTSMRNGLYFLKIITPDGSCVRKVQVLK